MKHPYGFFVVPRVDVVNGFVGGKLCIYPPHKNKSSPEPFWGNFSVSGISGSNSGVIALPTQTMHYLREIIQNHLVFALFHQFLQTCMIEWSMRNLNKQGKIWSFKTRASWHQKGVLQHLALKLEDFLKRTSQDVLLVSHVASQKPSEAPRNIPFLRLQGVWHVTSWQRGNSQLLTITFHRCS